MSNVIRLVSSRTGIVERLMTMAGIPPQDWDPAICSANFSLRARNFTAEGLTLLDVAPCAGHAAEVRSPALLEELLAFVKADPGSLREFFPIVAMGSLMVDVYGDECYPYAYIQDGRPHIGLTWRDDSGKMPEGYRFLVHVEE